MTSIDQLLDTARAEIGITEYPAGTNRVKYNEWFYGQVVYDGLWGTTFPWCMAFVQWVFDRAGMTLPYKTAGCSPLLNWYQAHDAARIVHDPRPGDIVIYTFGHTGIVESVGGDAFVAIEGNTSLTSDDNGGAVMHRTRSMSQVRAFIRPFDTVEIEEDEDMTLDKFRELMKEYRAELQDNDVGTWSKEAREWAVSNGIIQGGTPINGEPNYMWEDSMTREQLVTVLYRFAQLIGKA